MKIFLDNEGKFLGSGDGNVFINGTDFVVDGLNDEQIKALKWGALWKDWKITETEKYLENKKNLEKQEKIKEFKILKEKAVKARSEYLAAELLPEGETKKQTLAFLGKNTEKMAKDLEEMIKNFASTYNENILLYSD